MSKLANIHGPTPAYVLAKNLERVADIKGLVLVVFTETGIEIWANNTVTNRDLAYAGMAITAEASHNFGPGHNE